MNRNNDEGEEGPPSPFTSIIRSWKSDRNSLLIVLGFVLAAILMTLVLGLIPGITAAASDAIAIGRAAPFDVVAVRKATYVDERATSLRVDAESRLTLSIFEMDGSVTRKTLDRYASFEDLLNGLLASRVAPDTLFLRVQRDYPGIFSRQDLAVIVTSPARSQELSDAAAILARILDRGIFAMPSTGLDTFSSDYLELRRGNGPIQDSVEMRMSDVVTLANLDAKVRDEAQQRRLSKSSEGRILSLVRKFAVENVFFDAGASARRLDAAVRQVDPVTRTIAPGQRILRKGLLITEADYAKYLAARAALSRPEWRRIAGDSIFVIGIAILSLILLGPGISGAKPDKGETILAASGLFLSWLIATLASSRSLLSDPSYVAFIIPGALMCLVFAVFSGQRFAILYGLVLSLFVLAAADYDPRTFVYTFLSTTTAAFAVRHAESRLDLVKAGLRLSVIEAIGAALLSVPFAEDPHSLVVPLAFAGANGIVSGLLALGAFPVLEQLLNAPTRFRLIELSDLNAPALQRLLAAAPGTYSHSVAVAHLAEAACREIGADPLLARVGAYYHDIGKVDQPEYFVENQGAYNRHDEINPRLSATVIRSHVKVGIEKARALGLPEEVVAIVAEHHGNGLISWFFDRANRDEEADPEDFSYPGQPPASREAAVIMLADATEAAVRTLKKPTPARIDALIKDIVLDRFRQGQLDRCDLTFLDLNTIRESFTRILAGQHHSRIEYPKSKEDGR
ncbi:MAG TPA: HDIG domain-containing protein [Rectinemataceae bacterium]|nr:HDIG domain-containing protein [Rectinemataceae bacterium]